MAYDARNLSVIAYANGFTLWHYGTEDSGFNPASDFNGAADLLRVGDIVLTSVTPEEGTKSTRIYGVTANGGSTVTAVEMATTITPEPEE